MLITVGHVIRIERGAIYENFFHRPFKITLKETILVSQSFTLYVNRKVKRSSKWNSKSQLSYLSKDLQDNVRCKKEKKENIYIYKKKKNKENVKSFFFSFFLITLRMAMQKYKYINHIMIRTRFDLVFRLLSPRFEREYERAQI